MADNMTCSYIFFESEMARLERVNRRWFVAWLITFVLLIGCVAGFLYYESQFVDEVVTQEVVQEADNGENHFIGGDYDGTADSTNNEENKNS